MYTSAVYRNAGVKGQEILLGLRAWVRAHLREGKAFKQEYKDVLATQWLDAQALDQLQLERLRKSVAQAMRDVPFYRERLGRLGIDPGAWTRLSDLDQIPLLDKQDVLDAGTDMFSTAKLGRRYSSTSSGTSGTFIRGERDLHSIVREQAFIARQLAWAGVALGQRRVWLRGDKIVPSGQTQGPFWRFNRADNTLMCSSYHLSEARVKDYVEAMQAFDPVCIQAYPASLMLLASVLDASGKRYAGASLRAIVTSSESISPAQKGLLGKVFGCPVFDWYGNFERVAAIGTCEQQRYHVLNDYSHVQFLPVDGERCELVGTTWDNAAMPWIRYRMHDLFTLEPAGRLCACGRHFPLVKTIEGRAQDYLLGPDGQRFMMPVNAFDDIEGLMEGQFVQTRVDEVEVLCRPAPQVVLDIAKIEQVLRNYLGPALRIQVRVVDAIARTESGKLKPVVRTVKGFEA